MNNDAWGTYNNRSQIKLKVKKLKSSLCNYSDAYIRVRGAIKLLDMEVTLQHKEQTKEIRK